MFSYYDSAICLRFKVKAKDAVEAGEVAEGFEVKAVNPCHGLEGVFDVEVALKPSDLDKLFGDSGSIRSAYRMAKAANAAREAEYEKHETGEARG